jgi:hypothetical protein
MRVLHVCVCFSDFTGAARLPAYRSPLTGLIAGKVCVESLVVNHVSNSFCLLNQNTVHILSTTQFSSFFF